MSKPYQPTPEQLALAEERRLKKLLRKDNVEKVVQGEILPRDWLTFLPSPDPLRTVKIMSWNEVDRTEILFPILEEAGYGCVYTAAPRKKHGCAIVYRKSAYEVCDARTVFYDNEAIRDGESDRFRRGSSFYTKNIANIVALKRTTDDNDGIITATTHLFWHPKKFNSAVDFNFQPDDAAYSLLVGDALLPAQSASLQSSRVVHVTIDPTVLVSSGATAGDEEGAESVPDKVITSARAAKPEDGLLSDVELTKFFERADRPVSAYDKGLRSQDPKLANLGLTFRDGPNRDFAPGRHGAFEPIYTSYTHAELLGRQ
ncbi:hypothetical protein PHLCEN_2v580 [Hermanssonia centrifuga]|uniref:Uncharacterized protein n=1 Tax=Hermanssonia centrifuga TaxID=98765 RepID=A0A2R6S5K5_9APHY|nr:hypothetical protein PHLCEN_2v580 [Hermanssonia centrifuga]